MSASEMDLILPVVLIGEHVRVVHPPSTSRTTKSEYVV